MGEKSEISWTNGTFNPWHGCLKVSPGCENCYAESVSKRWGKDIWGPATTTDRQLASDAYWRGPVNWNRKAQAAGVPYKVFTASMADIMEDHPMVEEARWRLFRLVIETPWLIWQFLTKRPENYAKYLPPDWLNGRFPSNVWLGTSVESQEYAEKRLPHLFEINGAPVYWVSYEPALGPVDFRPWMASRAERERGIQGLDWLVVGGESGPKARPFNVIWADTTISDCRQFGAAPFVKQLGSKPVWPYTNAAYKLVTHNDEDPEHPHQHPPTGKADDPNEWPFSLQVQEFPVHPSPAREAAHAL